MLGVGKDRVTHRGKPKEMRKIAVPVTISLIAVIGALLFVFLSSDGGLDSPYSVDTEVATFEDDLDDTLADVNLSGRTEIAAENPAAEIVSPAVEGATLSGTVGDAYGDPIAGARVFLQADSDDSRGRSDFTQIIRDRILRRGVSTQGSELAQTTADEQGRYVFLLATIERGNYRVYARHDEFAAAYERWKWTPESSVVDFRLARGSFITGIVLDQRDLPIAGAVVEAHPDSDRGRGFGGRGRGRSSSRSLADKTTTGSDGLFRMSLTSGTYRI